MTFQEERREPCPSGRWGWGVPGGCSPVLSSAVLLGSISLWGLVAGEWGRAGVSSAGDTGLDIWAWHTPQEVLFPAPFLSFTTLALSLLVPAPPVASCDVFPRATQTHASSRTRSLAVPLFVTATASL